MLNGGWYIVNQEDSIIMNKSSVERGLFNSVAFKGYTSTIEKNQYSSLDDIYSKPNVEVTSGIRNEVNYDKINESGFPDKETVIENNEAFIGKVAPITGENTNKLYKDKSTIYSGINPAVVDDVYQEINSDGYETCKVKLRSYRVPIIGDKFTSRAGQKATVGLLLDSVNMPYTENGIVPDIIINSNALPSRMTIGQLYEMITSKLGAIHGQFYDATPFEDIDMDAIYNQLEKAGYKKDGTEIMYSGITGDRLEAEIFFAPCYYTRLKHLVSEKIHARSIGSTQILTRQPPEGGRTHRKECCVLAQVYPKDMLVIGMMATHPNCGDILTFIIIILKIN